MGRGRGGSRNRGNFRNKGKHHGDRGAVRSEPWSDIKRENDLYETYYRTGGFLEEEEFEQMWKALASNLPNSFRFTGTKADALAVREIFKQRYIPAIKDVEFEGQPVEPPEPVNAFPDELVWHMKTDKKVIRRHKPFAEFQKFLVAETTAGNISRQEVVSMIPPHFLDVRPGMVVLDMCAAPGSKSAQLAEMIHGDEEDRVQRAASNVPFDATEGGDYSDDGRSTGLLVANDTDYKRAGMLVHQVKRLNFPNLIVTQHDASIFPSIEMPPVAGSTKAQYLKFDRVLADVPCSGDGTARKNVNVWQKWTPRDGLGLHNLQLRILMRGLQLLKKGGRLVYSTCSMNPVENEAVVASAIEACGGIAKVQLVDCSDYLPNLKRKPGLNTWKILDTSAINGDDKINHMFSSWEAFLTTKEKYEKEEPGRQFSQKIAPGVFPPATASENQRIPLERCIRVYPHQQDTGGFFIAVLEKLDDIKMAPVANASSSSATPKTQAETPTPVVIDDLTKAKAAEKAALIEGTNTVDIPVPSSPTKRKLEAPDEEVNAKRTKTEIGGENDAKIPVKESTSDQDTAVATNGTAKADQEKPATNGSTKPEQSHAVRLKSENQNQQKEYFEYLANDDTTIAGIFDFFGISRFPRDRFLVRNKEGLALNKVYYTSKLAKTIIQQNKNRGFKFIHCGVVMFVSHKIRDTDSKQSNWRLQNEGIRILEPWATKRIINCNSRDSFYRLLIEMFPKLPKDGSHELGEVGEQLMALDTGCCFLKVDKKDGEDGFPFPMVLPLWRHPGSANMMVDKDDRKAMLLRLYNEQNPNIINHVVDKAKAEAAEAAAAEKEAADAEVMAEADGVEEAGVKGDADEMVIDA